MIETHPIVAPRLHRASRSSIRALVATLLCAVSLSCGRGETRPHESLTASAEPLRTAFNADVGKPRILILAAPT